MTIEAETQTTLRSIAKEAFAQSDKIEDELAIMLSRLEADPDLDRSLYSQLRRSACLEMLYDVRHNDVTSIKSNVCTRGIDAIAAAGEVAMRSIMDWPIGNKRLGDLLGSELLPLAEQESALAFGHAVNSAFLRALSDRVKDERTVRESLSEKQAAELFKQSKSSVETTIAKQPIGKLSKPNTNGKAGQKNGDALAPSARRRSSLTKQVA
jgi:hypothetical protein